MYILDEGTMEGWSGHLNIPQPIFDVCKQEQRWSDWCCVFGFFVFFYNVYSFSFVNIIG